MLKERFFRYYMGDEINFEKILLIDNVNVDQKGNISVDNVDIESINADWVWYDGQWFDISKYHH